MSYSITGTFNSGNVFQAQISDQFGSFTTSTVLGSVTSVNSGSITCIIPIATNSGSSYRIRVVSSNPNVTGSNNGVSITVNPLPLPVITGNSSVCQGATNIQYSVTPVSGHSYQWYQPLRGTIISGSASSTVTINWTGSTGTEQLKMRQTNNSTGCSKDTILNVTINPSPTPFITGKIIVCEGERLILYQVQSVNNHSYQWQPLTKGTYATTTTSSTVSINWNNNASGFETLKVRQTNNLTGCFKDTTLSIYISPKPKPVISGLNIVCVGSVFEYSVVSQSNYSYQWQYPSNGKITNSIYGNTVSINWTKMGKDTLTIRQTDNTTGCFKDTTFIVNINNAPNPTITGTNTICFSGPIETYSVQNVSGYSYSWYGIDRGTIVSGSTSSSVKVLWDKSIGYDSIFVLVTDKLTGCSTIGRYQVEVIEAPKVEIFGPNTACENQQNLVFKTVKKIGSTYTWSVLTQNLSIKGNYKGDSVIINARSIGVGFIKLTEMNSQGCVRDTTISLLIENGLKPEITSFGGENYMCKGDSRGLECKLSDTYQWKRDGVIIQGATDRVYLAFIPGKYSVVTKSGDCIGESELFTLYEFPIPIPVISAALAIGAGIAIESNNAVSGIRTNCFNFIKSI